ncbi:B12-binding domain-containing radical SAM protein [Streptomyces sp. bgisy031]|uniref:B12-binding domain-containing radical SAM protein n=1 Tax=Streptomyces sp. bgisy031 TaxID=3413772 RepID=UPI003D75F181
MTETMMGRLNTDVDAALQPRQASSGRTLAGRKVLVVRPPQVLSYFNAGHHLALYQVAGHLRRAVSDAVVTVIDASVTAMTWKDMADELFRGQYDFIAVMNDLDGVDGLARFLHYAASLLPDARTVTFGRLSSLHAELLDRYDLDAVVVSGDFEPGVLGACVAMETGSWSAPGVRFKAGGKWIAPTVRGAYLQPSEWALPDPGEIPYEHYERLYSQDSRKFPGLPDRRELVVPVARGCPMGCAFCEVTSAFGSAERRLGVDRVVEYIRACMTRMDFDYVSFYAPTFTLNKAWVRQLCDSLASLPRPMPWKCCTTMHHLDAELVAAMGAAHCVRISVGLETLDSDAYSGLPRAKRQNEEDLRALAAACAAAGVELNCFVVVGLPGTTVESARKTIETALALGARVRPTLFTPYDTLSAKSTDLEIMAMNRQTFVPGSVSFDSHEQHDAYGLLFGAKATAVSDGGRG